MIRRAAVALVVLFFAQAAFAAGGTVRPATEGRGLDFVYAIATPPGPNDRAITRYGIPGAPFPTGSEFDPNSVICGARVRSGYQSSVAGDRPQLVDLRLEDPANPGFPDVTTVPAPGVVFPIAADSNAMPPACTSAVSFLLFSFNFGMGVPDPQVATFLSWRFTPPAGSPGDLDPCRLGLELGSAPGNGRALVYDSSLGTYGPLVRGSTPGNHWLEMIVATPPGLDLRFRMHGARRFVGDPGLPIWSLFGAPGVCPDDLMSTTIVVDNTTLAPIGPQVLSLVADLSVLALPPKDVSGLFFVLPKVTLAAGNPYAWAPGRTDLRASMPAAIPAKFAKVFAKVSPVNIPFIASSTPEPPPGPFDSETAVLGWRQHRGQIDDGSPEAAFIVQSPAVTGDVMAQRFPLIRLFPVCAPPLPVPAIGVMGTVVGAVSNGGAGGFDAIQIRTSDPIIPNSADPSPFAVFGGVGVVGDGIVGAPVPVDPAGAIALFPFPLPVPAVVPAVEDAWLNVYPFPGDTLAAGTFLAQDRTYATLLRQSFFSRAGDQPYTADVNGNWIARILFAPIPVVPGDGEWVPPRLTGNLQVVPRVAGEIPRLSMR